MTQTQIKATPEQLQLAEECQKQAYAMAEDDRTTYKDYGIQSALIAIQHTEARLQAAVEAERHKQARWFAMNVRDAGPDLPSRQKWEGLHGLAIKFLDLLESDPPAAIRNPS